MPSPVSLPWMPFINIQVPFRDLNMILDLCYSSAWLAGVTCILHFAYKFIKNYTYVTVNCWFCNENSRIPFRQKNEWICLRCEQFNGFTKDGDYSKFIPEQFGEQPSVRKLYPTINGSKFLSQNGLCRICNTNQELKVRLLASYVPLKEEEYDLEMELYRNKLEQSYKLCSICEHTVQNTLKLKSRMYCEKNVLVNQKYSKKQYSTDEDNSKKWKHSPTLLFAALIVALLWKFPEYISDYEVSIVLPKVFDQFLFVKKSKNLYLLNILFSISIALFTKIYFERSRLIALSNFLLFSILSFVADDYIHLELKISGIIFGVIYVGYKYVKRKVCVDGLKEAPKKYDAILLEKADRYFESAGKSSPCKPQNLDLPICGKLSDLNLGRAGLVSSASKPSYLFKSSTLLVQPAKLVLDDPDESTDTIRTFATVSSGYNSSVSNFKRSSDSISEFDSVSQVGLRYSSNFCRSPNTFHSRTSERCYDLSYPSSQNFTSHTSHIQNSVFFSTIQIFLCSLVFFILGFSFQILLSNLTSWNLRI